MIVVLQASKQQMEMVTLLSTYTITWMYSECAKQANVPKFLTSQINIAIILPQRLKLIESTLNPLLQTPL